MHPIHVPMNKDDVGSKRASRARGARQSKGCRLTSALGGPRLKMISLSKKPHTEHKDARCARKYPHIASAMFSRLLFIHSKLWSHLVITIFINHMTGTTFRKGVFTTSQYADSDTPPHLIKYLHQRKHAHVLPDQLRRFSADVAVAR